MWWTVCFQISDFVIMVYNQSESCIFVTSKDCEKSLIFARDKRASEIHAHWRDTGGGHACPLMLARRVRVFRPLSYFLTKFETYLFSRYLLASRDGVVVIALASQLRGPG